MQAAPDSFTTKKWDLQLSTDAASLPSDSSKITIDAATLAAEEADRSLGPAQTEEHR